LDHKPTGTAPSQTCLIIGDSPLTPRGLSDAVKTGQKVEISPKAHQRLGAARELVDDIVARKDPVYGVNTGVGSQKDHAVQAHEAAEYNRLLARAHGTRVPGPQARPDTVRATLILLINELCHGNAGVSPTLVELMVSKVNDDAMPPIDASGSVGASDLVPLAQLANWIFDDPRAVEAGLPDVKDTLCLINCNAFSLAAGSLCIADLDQLFVAFDLAAAMSYEGFRCNLDAIHPVVADAVCRSGQQETARNMSDLLADSALHTSGASRFLQDPLSFRNASQIIGAARKVAEFLTTTWCDEISSNAVNPLIDTQSQRAYSHGNMDTTGMTLAVDAMRQALGKVADVSGERVHKQQWPAFSHLPISLARDHSPSGGVQFLNLGHITASLITSVKIWAAPHLLHSVGQVADGVEDTSANSVHAVHDLERQIDACFKIATLEACVAVWAIERRGINCEALGTGVRDIYAELRDLLPIGIEGRSVFDLGPVVALFRTHVAQQNRRLS
jgi:histidine ammonia-lyase